MPKREKYKVGLVQMSMGADVDENLQKAVGFAEEAAGKGAKIICLPEMFRSQYFCQKEDADLFDLAEPLDGPSSKALSKVADKTGATIIAPIFEQRALGLYHNSLILIKPGEPVAGVYRKMHIPDDPAYYEKFYFTPGDMGFKAFDTDQGRIGTLICWDQWYPEGARLTALRGAEILFYPTAIGWHPYEKEEFGEQQRDGWRTIQDSPTRDTTLGVHVADLETPCLAIGERVDFTLYWPEARRWEGADFVVWVERPSAESTMASQFIAVPALDRVSKEAMHQRENAETLMPTVQRSLIR